MTFVRREIDGVNMTTGCRSFLTILYRKQLTFQAGKRAEYNVQKERNSDPNSHIYRTASKGSADRDFNLENLDKTAPGQRPSLAEQIAVMQRGSCSCGRTSPVCRRGIVRNFQVRRGCCSRWRNCWPTPTWTRSRWSATGIQRLQPGGAHPATDARPPAATTSS